MRTLRRAFAAMVMSFAARAEAQHTHGEAQLDIGIDGTSGAMELRIPGDDLYGFEHQPRTAVERAKRDSAVAKLRSQASSLVRFDAAFGCAVTPGPVRFSAGKHVEVSARYTFSCRRAPIGRDIRFGVTSVFPSVHILRVQLVTETAQLNTTITDDKGVLRP